MTFPSTVYEDATEWVPPQTTDPIENYNGSVCGGDLNEVFTRSCNIPFAQMSVDLGVDRMPAGVAEWGLGEPVPFDLPSAVASTFGDTSNLAQEIPLLAIVASVRTTSDGAAAHGDGRVDGRQRRADDAALIPSPRTLDPRRLGGPEPNRAWTVWKNADLARHRDHAQRGADGRARAERGTAKCCLQLENGQVPGGRQDRHRPAQLGSASEQKRSHGWITVFAPAEAPLCFAVAVIPQGHQRRDLSEGTGGRARRTDREDRSSTSLLGLTGSRPRDDRGPGDVVDR